MENLAVEQIGLASDALSGQVTVVTGGGQGIGREVAIAFARLGASVIIAGTSAANRETERIIKGGGGEALFIKADVAKEADAARLARQAKEAYGPADILINNTSVSGAGSVLGLEATDWDRAVATNLRGTFLTCKAFLPQMLARGQGTVLNVTPAGAAPLHPAYTASGHGIADFSRSLAAAVGAKGVRVIALVAGTAGAKGPREAYRGQASRPDVQADAFSGTAMPASQVAAAMVYLVVALADECHGEQVNASTVLERAGLVVTPSSDVEGTARAEALQQAVTLSERLHQAIVQTRAELVQMPAFVRPLAEDGFEKKAGQRIEDWSRTAAELTRRLRKMAAADRAAEARFCAEYPRLKPMFAGLMRYYQEMLSEPACFTTHTDSVARAKQAMRERESVVRSLLQALEMIQ